MIGTLVLSSLSIGHGAEVKVDWKWDSIVTVAALSTYGLLELQKPRDQTLNAEPKGLDAWVHPQWNPEFSDISDFLGHPLTLYGLNLPVLSTIGLTALSINQQGIESGFAHGMIVLQAVAINGAVTEALKLSISRPRPFTSASFQTAYSEAHAGDYIQSELTGGDSHQSMPSGHTSTAGATYFCMATLLAHQVQKNWTKGALYGSAGLLTIATAASRVWYGMHHPSDTLVGGLLGAGIGYGVAMLHLDSKANLGLNSNQDGFQIGMNGVW